MAVLHLNNENFDKTINSGKVVLVDFWANWCGPCKMIAPVIEEVEKDISDKAVIGKVDVDNEEELARKFGIMSIPSLLLFKNGEVIDKMIGLPRSNPKDAIKELIENNL